MYHIEDPEEMTPEERFQEVAAILAKGFLRLKRREQGVAEPSFEGPNQPDSFGKSAGNPPSKSPPS
jgi:hypothetical protein